MKADMNPPSTIINRARDPKLNALLAELAKIGSTPISNDEWIVNAMIAGGEDPANKKLKGKWGAQTSQLFKKRAFIRTPKSEGPHRVLPFPADGVIPEGWEAWERGRYANITDRKVGGTRKKDAAAWEDWLAKELATLDERKRVVRSQFAEGVKACAEAAAKAAEAQGQVARDLAAAAERCAHMLAQEEAPATA